MRKTKLTAHTLNQEGLERKYYIFESEQEENLSLNQKEKKALVILLHGGGGIARRIISFTGFDQIACANNLILLAPEAIERHWNDGRVNTGYKCHENNIDDVAFISELIDRLRAEYKFDSQKIYCTGFSNGGMMSYRLGLELPEKIAAIAPVAAALPEELVLRSKGKEPVAVCIINGTEDPLIPWQGGSIVAAARINSAIQKRDLGRVMSVPDSLAYWVKLNNCNTKPKVISLPPNKDEPNILVNKTQYEGSKTVVFYGIQGAGHVWPGQEQYGQYLPENIIGKYCNYFKASQAIWEFFQTV